MIIEYLLYKKEKKKKHMYKEYNLTFTFTIKKEKQVQSSLLAFHILPTSANCKYTFKTCFVLFEQA